jgi:hypothetical protein
VQTAAADLVGAPVDPTRRFPTVDGVVAALVGVLSFVIAVRPALDNDLFFHLRTADWMVDHHQWVGADPFTYTRPDVVRVQTDWLAQLSLGGAWKLAGLTGVALLVSAVLAVAMVVLYRTMDGPVRVRAGVCLLVAAASSIFWSARPQAFTFLGMVLVLAILRSWRKDPATWRLAWLVPLFLVWVNTHGGVVYGLLLVLGTLVGELGNRRFGRNPLSLGALRRLGWVTLACAAVMVANPSGARVYLLPFEQVSSAAKYVQEVQPPSLGDPTAWPFFLLAVLTVVLLVHGHRSLDLVEVALTFGTLAFALRFVRSIPFFAVVGGLVVARHLAERFEDRDPAWRPRAAAPGGLVTVLVVAVLAAGFLSANRLATDRVAAIEAEEYPVGAVEWLREQGIQPQLFSTFDWGGYLMWELRSRRVAIDGRTDVYDDYLDVYDSVMRAEPGWEDELRRIGANEALLEPDSPLATALRADDEWSLVYEDPVAVVFDRTRGQESVPVDEHLVFVG